ncbi:MAG: lysylphosphatidylglycerol synthase domain-containing protein [Thermodesulfobacteriota bacterium]
MSSLTNEKRRIRSLQILQWAIVLAVFLFLGKMVWDNWSQVKDTQFTFRPFPLLSSTLIFVFSYFIQIWAWYLITLKLKIALSPSETLKSWFYSQLGKYLPGKVWLLLSRFYFYESRGKSKKSISVALYFEIVTIIAAAGLIFLAALIFHREIWLFYSWRQSGWLVLLLLLGFVSLHPRVLQKILNWILVQFKWEPISLSISYSNILWILFVCIVSWVVGGVGFYLFVDSVYPVAPQYILFLTGALAISSTLGLIAIFAPSGLGVREGALVYLFSSIMPTPVAVIISILTRIWMTLIEIGLIGMVYLISQFHKRLGKGDQNV